MLELRNIKKDYVTSSETVNALRGVDITFRDKEFVSILGPSGCGKTTMLNIIGGLDRYSSGDLVINGRSTKLYRDRDWDVYRNHRVGFIFQSYHLLPEFTAVENVMMPMLIAGVKRREAELRAKKLLELVGMSHRSEHKPEALSGGEQQRVAIARALSNRPSVVLADEPTGNLDTATRDEIQRLFVELRDRTGQTFVIVTHDVELAERSDRTIRMSDGRVL